MYKHSKRLFWSACLSLKITRVQLNPKPHFSNSAIKLALQTDVHYRLRQNVQFSTVTCSAQFHLLAVGRLNRSHRWTSHTLCFQNTLSVTWNIAKLTLNSNFKSCSGTSTSPSKSPSNFPIIFTFNCEIEWTVGKSMTQVF